VPPNRVLVGERSEILALSWAWITIEVKNIA
jgi:hypothetical protein